MLQTHFSSGYILRSGNETTLVKLVTRVVVTERRYCEPEFRQDAAETHLVCHPSVYLLLCHRTAGARRSRLQGVGTVCRFYDKIQ